MKIENSQGKVMYGLHFYSGVAEYQEPGMEPFRVYLNENTLRSMDASFAGKPIFVDHVDSVEDRVDELRKEADGWVIESFYNSSDGKHWVKFILTSEKAFRAVQNGMRLSNAYIPKSYDKGGLWNGVEYSREIKVAEYEHLAIVDNPRYEESVIMTPEEFKKYNQEQEIELKRIANSKDQSTEGERKMGLNFFKRSKVENTIDLESTMVELPKSKKEMKISELVGEMDRIMNMHGYANGDHLVKVGEHEMSVNDLVKKHMDACGEIEKMKAKNAESEDGGEPGKGADDDMENDADEEGTVSSGMKDVGDRGGDKSLDNEDDEEKKKEKKENALKKASALKNAGPHREAVQPVHIITNIDRVAKGKARYGSN